MDTSWYLDVNRFARRTPSAHGFMTAYAQRALSPVGAGLLVLAALVIVAGLTSRGKLKYMLGVLVAGLGAFAALGLQQVIAPLIGLRHPEVANAQLLLPRDTGYALPDARTAMAGAVVAGLALSRRRWLAPVALAAALLLAFSRVYVGVAFPSDVAAGLGFGAAVAVVLWPIGAWVVGPVLSRLAGERVGVPVVVKRARPRPTRQHGSRRLAPARTPNTRAMDALRVASEAARHANTSLSANTNGDPEQRAAPKNT